VKVIQLHHHSSSGIYTVFVWWILCQCLFTKSESESQFELYFGINVSISKLMQQAPMEAALSSVVILWESNGLFINFRSLFPAKKWQGCILKGYARNLNEAIQE
jgi:hypothetical protein